MAYLNFNCRRPCTATMSYRFFRPDETIRSAVLGKTAIRALHADPVLRRLFRGWLREDHRLHPARRGERGGAPR